MLTPIKRYLVVSIVTVFYLFSGEPFCYFIPPKDWHCVDPTHLPDCVEIKFFAPKIHGFIPCINLAKESIDNTSLKEYLKAVKEIHYEDKNTKEWRDLGPFPIQAEKAQLTEIRKETPWGRVKMWQLIYIKNQTAYLITAAATQEEFPLLRPHFLKAFRSLKYTEDLISEIPDPSQREHLKKTFQTLQSLKTDEATFSHLWKSFEQEVSTHQSLGPHWQYLLLKDSYPSPH